jgi:hypothetical protein
MSDSVRLSESHILRSADELGSDVPPNIAAAYRHMNRFPLFDSGAMRAHQVRGRSRTFAAVTFDPKEADWVARWDHDGPDCPLEVPELRAAMARRSP